MHKQRGVSLMGLLIIGSMVAFLMLLGFKLVPAYQGKRLAGDCSQL